jgi:hypothetical protein
MEGSIRTTRTVTANAPCCALRTLPNSFSFGLTAVSQHLMTCMFRQAQNGPKVLISTHTKIFWCAISKGAVFIRLSTNVINRTTMMSNILVPAYHPACNTVTVLTELHLFQLVSAGRRKRVQMFTSRTHIYNLLLNKIFSFGLKWFICYVHKTTPRKFW